MGPEQAAATPPVSPTGWNPLVPGLVRVKEVQAIHFEEIPNQVPERVPDVVSLLRIRTLR